MGCVANRATGHGPVPSGGKATAAAFQRCSNAERVSCRRSRRGRLQWESEEIALRVFYGLDLCMDPSGIPHTACHAAAPRVVPLHDRTRVEQPDERARSARPSSCRSTPTCARPTCAHNRTLSERQRSGEDGEGRRRTRTGGGSEHLRICWLISASVSQNPAVRYSCCADSLTEPSARPYTHTDS